MGAGELWFLFSLGIVHAVAYRLVVNLLVLWPLLTPVGAFFNNLQAADIELPWPSIAGFADVLALMAVVIWSPTVTSNEQARTTSMPTPTPPDTRTAGRTSPAEPRRTVSRLTTGWGWFMLSMAGVNAWLAATGESQLYVEFAETAYLELYRDAWDALVEPHPLPWVLALVAFEAAAGTATLGDGSSGCGRRPCSSSR